MFDRFKEYLEYRKNRKTAKRELSKIAAVTLSAVREISDKGNDIIKFMSKLAQAADNVNNEELIKIIINELSCALQTDNEHIIEFLKYMVNLSPEDIQKITEHSVIKSTDITA